MELRHQQFFVRAGEDTMKHTAAPALGLPVSLTGAGQMGAFAQLQFRVRSQRGID
jgi:hypothetical protein